VERIRKGAKRKILSSSSAMAIRRDRIAGSVSCVWVGRCGQRNLNRGHSGSFVRVVLVARTSEIEWP
jgi:hypothetical protein